MTVSHTEVVSNDTSRTLSLTKKSTNDRAMLNQDVMNTSSHPEALGVPTLGVGKLPEIDYAITLPQ